MEREEKRPPRTDIVGVYIAYRENDLSALSHLLEFLKKHFQLVTKKPGKKKSYRIKKIHPVCQVFNTTISLERLIDDFDSLDGVPDICIAVGFRFAEDRELFRSYKTELEKTKKEELKAVRKIYGEVHKDHFPDKEKMN